MLVFILCVCFCALCSKCKIEGKLYDLCFGFREIRLHGVSGGGHYALLGGAVSCILVLYHCGLSGTLL